MFKKWQGGAKKHGGIGNAASRQTKNIIKEVGQAANDDPEMMYMLGFEDECEELWC